MADDLTKMCDDYRARGFKHIAALIERAATMTEADEAKAFSTPEDQRDLKIIYAQMQQLIVEIDEISKLLKGLPLTPALRVRLGRIDGICKDVLESLASHYPEPNKQ